MQGVSRRRTLGIAAGTRTSLTPEVLSHLAEHASHARFQLIAFHPGGDDAPAFGAVALDALVLTSAETAAAATVLGIPIITVNDSAAQSRPFDQLMLDRELSGSSIAEYVASSGKTSVGLISVRGSPSASVRGFMSGVSNFDLVLAREHVATCEAGRAHGFEAIREMLRNVSTLPQAIYCDEEGMACGVFEALRAEGIRIPQDIWLLCHGRSELTESPFYGITAAAPDPQRLAEDLFAMIWTRIREPDLEPQVKRLRYEVMANASTGFFRVSRQAL